MGYQRVEAGGLRLLPGPLAHELMYKQLSPPPGSRCPVLLGAGGVRGDGVALRESKDRREGVTDIVGVRRAKDGVFIWNALAGEGPEPENW